MLFLVVLFLVVATARTCPPTTRDDLLVCLAHVDSNEDGTLTAEELDAWIGNHTACLPLRFSQHYSGASIMAQCDMDVSGNLTMHDWTVEGACFTLPSRQRLLCDWCVHCDQYPQ